MYQTSLLFRIKDSAALEKHRILEIFFKSWIDNTCNNEVGYTLEKVAEVSTDVSQWQELYRVDFEHIEDATVLRLKGIPTELQNYVEIVT